MGSNETLKQWDWREMCGPNGLVIWSYETNDIGLCFQQLFIQIPILFVLAIVSSYYFAKSTDYLSRDRLQVLAINLRSIVSICLAVVPLIEIYIFLTLPNLKLYPIDYFLGFTEFIVWTVHFAFLTSLKRRLDRSPRGPLVICILWFIVFVSCVVSVRSHYIYNQVFPSDSVHLSVICSYSILVLHAIYAMTLIPNERTTHVSIFSSVATNFETIGERAPLLGGHNQSYTRFLDDNNPDYLGVAMEDVPILSKLLFYWVNPLMEKGFYESLKEPDDLFDLPIDISCNVVSQKFSMALSGQLDRIVRQPIQELSESSPLLRPESNHEPQPKKRTLLKALHKCFAWHFYSIGILKLIADMCGFAGPLLLYGLVKFIEDKREDIKFGYFYACGLCVTTLISALCNAHFNFQMGLVGLKIRSAIITIVYSKTLTVNSATLMNKFNMGEIINFMTTDVDRIVNSCPSFHAIWSIPFQLFVTLYLLYEQVGIASLTGIVFTMLVLPVNKCIASKIGELSNELMKKKDQRVRMMSEILKGIETIKLYVWEGYFIRTVTMVREKELKYLKGRKYLDALCVYFWATTPVLISTTTFTAYVLMGNKLTAATVFSSIALMNMLIGPLNAFPWVLNGVIEAWVSLKRIQNLINLTEFDVDKYYTQFSESSSNVHLFVKNASFKWDMNQQKHVGHQVRRSSKQQHELDKKVVARSSSIKHDFELSNINFVVKKGGFLGVCGTVGSGKSTLLAAILGEVFKTNGNIVVDELEYGFGYVPQEPWLQRGTIRDNILFGKNYDNFRYRSVLFACGLVDDIERLQKGDFTGISETGSTLSGGQKARIGLARAVYQDKPIYILDDILSSVDVKVAHHIFNHCIMGLLKDKTKILCTHHTKFLAQADHIIVLENGQMTKEGTPADIFSDIDLLIQTEIDISSESSSVKLDKPKEKKIVEQMSSGSDNDSLLEKEISASGIVDFSIYISYVRAIGFGLSLSIIIALLLMQLSRNSIDLWLSHWVTNDNINVSTINHFNSSINNIPALINIINSNNIESINNNNNISSINNNKLRSINDALSINKILNLNNVSSINNIESSINDTLNKNNFASINNNIPSINNTSSINNNNSNINDTLSINNIESINNIDSINNIKIASSMNDASNKNKMSNKTVLVMTHKKNTKVKDYVTSVVDRIKLLLDLDIPKQLFEQSEINLDDTVKYYLTIYGLLGMCNSIFTLLRAFLFAYGGINAAKRIHSTLLYVVIRAKILFFNISPIGRILNRFSSDTYTVDDSLPFILNILLAQLFGLTGSIIVTIYGLPWLILILIPLIPIYNWLQSHYRMTSRELKRLSSVTLSPIYSHFNETLQGLESIRGFRVSQRFKRDNEEHVEMNLKTLFASQAASQWLDLRLQFIGVALITGIGLIAVLQHQFNTVSAGLIGLSISYALSITGILNGLVNSFTETERELIAVERINQYIEEVEPELDYSTNLNDSQNPPYAWPSQGVILFDNVSLRYREHLFPSLKSVCFETRPAEKIGVVGRTGAGKSSLLVSMFRLIELWSGTIHIDNVDISKIPLSILRSRMSIIPQDPFLFSGTIRENIDPFREFRSDEIWNALNKCNLTGLVKRLGGLESNVESAGQNLSVGQKQLFCLARAVLRKTKILCIDEATANVDYETDRQIQQTIRAAFSKSTVITIAHRIETILDYDRVLVMSDGNVVEFGPPNQLLQDTTSNFYQLANNIFD